MKIEDHRKTPAFARKGVAGAVQAALAVGLLAGTTGAWAQFQEKTDFPEVQPTPPPRPAPRFQEAPDTTDLVADTLRQEQATNFLNQENLSLKADAELNFDGRFPQEGDNTYDAGGRVRVTFEGNHSAGDRFVTGRADALFSEAGGASTDDAWVAFGDAAWDVQLGRFEGINLFPLGLDTVLVNATGDGSARVYQTNLARGRVGNDGGAGVSFRYRFNEAARFEVDTAWGNLGNNSGGDKTRAVTGVRPSLTFGQGPVSVSVGGEIVDLDLASGGEREQWGAGASVSYKGGPASARFNFAYLDDTEAAAPAEVYSANANLIYDGRLGVGVLHSITELENSDLEPTVTTVYAAYVTPIFGFNRFKVTFAGSYSVSDDAGPNDEIGALRVRFNYAF